MLLDLFPEFFTIAIMHLFAVMSPGPDFALILRQSFHFGRKSSLITSLGIGVGIIIHIIYCITGLGVIIERFPNIFNMIKVCGGIYLIYLGFNSINSKIDIRTESIETINPLSYKNSFLIGFITNILNPKATLFFLSLYTFIIAEQPNYLIQCFYGIWMSLITTLWFCLISILLTNKYILNKMNKFFNIIQYGTSLLLIFIGLKLLF